MYINKLFVDNYYLFRPTQEEIANARVHSERADTKGHRLEKRFGHPALHMELFTPMVHAKHTHLLAEVYHGRIGSSETRMNEFGGAKIETSIAPGGIKIAGIEQVRSNLSDSGFQKLTLLERP
jgi:calcium permeable stress-gated cation channel